ncbi:MAG: nuclease [Acidobacteriaceae bacterium]|nr:nuclease [Acidobacteriaceae bacterium]
MTKENLRKLAHLAVAAAMVPALTAQTALAWGNDGHKMINRLAAANLPKDVPAFLRSASALDTLEYLGSEPDRWRNKAEADLAATQTPEHFIDLEYADLIGTLPRKRYDYVRALAKAQAEYPNLRLTPERVGLQPYAAEEVYERLKSTMRDYRHLHAAGRNTKPVETAILFYAGWLGHYAGDGSQPLHVTIQYGGWTGPNPHGYTTDHWIHPRFEVEYVSRNIHASGVAPLVKAAQPKLLNDEWNDYLSYLRRSATQVERIYQLDKAGGFSGTGTPEARAFVEERLAAGAIELRDMIYTAWVRSGDPVEDYYGSY